MAIAYLFPPACSYALKRFRINLQEKSSHSLGVLTTSTLGPSYYNFVRSYVVGTQIFLVKSSKANLNGG